MLKKILGTSCALLLGVVTLASPASAGPGENNIVQPDPKPPIVVYGPGENN